ncbi:hypothetical protein CLU79DRAFT_741230 [Phycomyces nitens]|nr:hypothetical protein CLU79DRAFT_741230 [Phycomyces nitens]
MTLVEEIQQYLSKSELHPDPEQSIAVGLHIVRLLRDVQCCYRCCLRFTKCHYMKTYKASEKDLGEAFNSLAELKGKPANNTETVSVCPACLGALGWMDQPENIQAVFDKIDTEDYDCKHVNLNCTMPISNLHRSHLLGIYVAEHLSEFPTSVLKMWNSEPVHDPKDAFKALISDKLVERYGWTMDPVTAPLRITIVLDHTETALEHRFLTQVKDPVMKLRKVRQNRKSITAGESRTTIVEALAALDKEEARKLTPIPPLPPTTQITLGDVAMVHEPTFVGGRYLKMSREYSQTPWEIKGKRLTEFSVSEAIEEIIKRHHRCDVSKFSTAGREDANVRMLGTGRPFYCELNNPRKPVLADEEYKRMEDEINNQPSKDAVQVRHLCRLSPSDTRIIKEGEESKRKSYRALVWLSQPITDEIIEKVNKAGSTPFMIKQTTPLRVFQRRSAAVREREIHSCHMERVEGAALSGIESHFGVLTLNTQAGTYIKEFVHGDLGRTLPNLATITGAVGADLIELDVLNVDLEWPPKK